MEKYPLSFISTPAVFGYNTDQTHESNARMHTLQFHDIAHCAVTYHSDTLIFDHVTCAPQTTIVGTNWQLSTAVMRAYLNTHADGYGAPFRVPVAAVIFDINHELEALGHFLPLINVLNRTHRHEFMARLNVLLRDPRLRISGHRAGTHVGLPLSARALSAGQILMCFFYRPDIIAGLLETQPSCDLFHSSADYARAGGVGGGCYDVRAHQIQLHLPRLYEGFFSPTPGVCPFLHEFGHMLDGTSMRQCRYAECRGELPGMSDTQRMAFARAKASEHACYMAHYHGRAPSDGSHPLGHPYVFQTDGEFLAGYWEMFWRNPHTMAQVCPALFTAWCDYTACDPRIALPHDFLWYVDGNRTFYQSGERPWPSSIRYHIN